MYAIEFEADLQDGVLVIPDDYKSLNKRHVRVVILFDDHRGDSGLRALSDHSATLVDEWRDPAEDEIWR